MKKIKVAVIMGGRSSEHEVSILSGQQVVKYLDKNKYEVLPIVISKVGKWQLTSIKNILSLKNTFALRGTDKEISLTVKKEIVETKSILEAGVDVVFIALHGPFGEDGTIQGMFELAGIPYTGAGVLTSALGMDKDYFRKIMKFSNLPIPKYVCLEKNDNLKLKVKILGDGPYFVKPVSAGSSVGCSFVKDKKGLAKAVKLAFEYDRRVLIDQYISGLEVTCGVVGNDKPIALPVIEIHPLKNKFFDYESKYTESGSEGIVPARISKLLTKKVQELAIKVYKAVGCRGFGRIDFILENNKKPIILEINTIPGLTPMSLLPKAAKAFGISYPILLDKIVKLSLEKK
ncbi:MAG TPA: D-alanine--D-alanine ligase [Patescibacteria group bacterium]|nr:D-alanine--D-alanine ligase [Patescibacteria group bacterium]